MVLGRWREKLRPVQAVFGRLACVCLLLCVHPLKAEDSTTGQRVFDQTSWFAEVDQLLAVSADTPSHARLAALWAAPDDLTIQAHSLADLKQKLPLPARTVRRLLAQLVSSASVDTDTAGSLPARRSGFITTQPARQTVWAQPRSRQWREEVRRTARHRRTAARQLTSDARLAVLQVMSAHLYDPALAPLNAAPPMPAPPPVPLPPPAVGAAGGFGAGAAASAAAGAVTTATVAGVAAGAGAVAAAASGGGSEKTAAGTGGGAGAGDGIGGGNENLDTAVWETAEYNANYGLGAINASTAYARGFTGDGVTVSVLDSPFDTNHADLQANLTTAYDALDGDSIVSCPTNGCVSSHGTHVAGTIGAVKNDTGMHGVAPEVTIKPVKIFGNDLSFVTTPQLVNAIAAGSGSGIAVMNNSWGSTKTDTLSYNGSTYYYKRPYYNYDDNNSSEFISGTQTINGVSSPIYGLYPTELSAWQTATDDTVVVFANGNDGLNTETGQIKLYSDSTTDTFVQYAANTGTSVNDNIPSFRGSYAVVDDNVSGQWLTVVAVDQNNQIASFSNGCGYAKDFCIAAPGVAIYSTYDVDDNSTSPPVSYKNLQGTSMAAPHVTGGLALLKEQFPNLTPEQLTTLVLTTATDLGANGTDTVYGVGLLNLAEASQPQGGVSIAGTNGHAVTGATMQNTSLQPSSVFGQALQVADLTIGVMDGYARAYNWQPTIIQAVQPRPSNQAFLDQLDRTAPEPVYRSDRLQLVSEGGSDDGLPDHLSFSYATPQAGLDLLRLSQTEPLLLDRQVDLPQLASSFLSASSQDILQLSSYWRLSDEIGLSARLLRGTTEQGHDFTEYAITTDLLSELVHSDITAGILTEQNSILGTGVSGVYQLARPAQTAYLQMGTNRYLSDNLQLQSRYSLLHTSAEAFYADLIGYHDLTADKASFQLDYRPHADQATSHQFGLALPLATTSGLLTQATTKGYQADGRYLSVYDRVSLVNPARQIDLYHIVQTKTPIGLNWYSAAQYSHNYAGIRGRSAVDMRVGAKLKF